MKCPYCNNSDTKVIDSRPVEDGLAIRRRRECEKCKKRFTTFEKIENSLLVVVKNDGRRESFDRNKLINGLLKACEKTKITYEDVEKIAERIERALNNTMEKEIESKMIGALIMDELRNLDQVAYVRFASVYHKFTDVNTFVQEVNRLQEKDRVRPEERNEEK
ncbi:MAG: transcriptional regulator NrdR [Clostridia bacterium]|uniref:Transcriptional repressor NrdR n=1 Tax=Mogibacterium kristiansenii TaxID=2606708 RepID=A0A6N7XJ16_9FIRM|nr:MULTISPECIES: transcriptional regulator NrdR [Mogibacterium]MDY5451184.1 transcriptional regulator NrdR [Clostridia bacterium]MCI7123350.1 transcriptional regulator NrdR [Mogibacterium sp.]MDD6699788.1 transcriptional regulator NrdR [Mogibacterium kristiansenii]MEE0369459.1 transcriptional regulator NrdR [Clostridia bacterium]MST69936.1 transcriptional repressor NrdR [Mogibacterium kristiansenii]